MTARKYQSAILLVAALLLCLCVPAFTKSAYGQKGTTAGKSGSHSVGPRGEMSAPTRALVEQAIEVICRERKLDPAGSMPIDEMQARPSLPVHTSEAQSGLERAQRVLPLAKNRVITALKQLAAEYGFQRSNRYQVRIQQAIDRVLEVKRIRPDMESRDNASVYLSRPHTITFGTIFLAGLKSDEGMISVLAHELMHIADGNGDSLRALVAAVSKRASLLTGLDIRGQRGEELTCDLIGAMAVSAYVADSPSYELITRRLARSVEHNCVDLDEGDEDHLSPRNTIRALLAINPNLVRELVTGR